MPRKAPPQAPVRDTHALGAAGAPAAASAGSAVSADAGGGPVAELGVEDLLPLAIPDAARKGPGRPKGSGNIRTEKTAQMLIGRYGDPMAATVAIGTMKLDALITWLRTVASDCGLRLGKDVGVVDLLRFQEECRRNVMPYLHAKRAAVDDKGDPALPFIGIGTFNQVNVSAGGRSIEDVVDGEIIEVNQGDSEASPEKSQEGKSHDDAND